jgi:ribonuclease P protein component
MKRSPTRQALTFGRAHRLLKRADFGKVYESGRKAHGRFVTLFAWRRPDADEPAPAPWRLGLTATRKTGGAVQRNRQRRRVREFFRLRQRDLPAGWDFVVNTKGSLNEGDFVDLENDLSGVLRRVGIELSRE